MGGVARIRRGCISIAGLNCLLTILLLLIGATGASARQQSCLAANNSRQPTGQISGHVYAADTGRPLAKAVVSLDNQAAGNTPNYPSVETKADGAFLFTAIAPGKYALSVERCGYLSEPRELVDDGGDPAESDAMVSLAPGEKRDGVDFSIVRGGIISGTVTDQDSEPVPGLLVEALALPFQPGGNQREFPVGAASAITDDLGNFRLIGLNQGSYFVKASLSGNRRPSGGNLQYRDVIYPDAYAMRDAQRVHVNTSTEAPNVHLTVRLERAYTVRGHAGGECQGVPGAFCFMNASAVGGLPERGTFNGQTDRDGSFEVDGIFPGEYAVTATLIRQAQGQPGNQGFGSAHVQVTDRDAETEISVGPSAEVSGVIVTESSKLVNAESLEIKLSRVFTGDGEVSNLRWLGGSDPEESSVDSKGRFKMEGIEPGTFVFALSANQNAQTSNPPANGITPADDPSLLYLKEVECSGRDYANQLLVLNAGMRLSDCRVKIGRDAGAISGRVLDGEKGVPGQVVVAIPASQELRRNPRYTLVSQTNRNGQFSISGIIPGDYLVFSVTPNEERSFYALDFADRNQQFAERITIKPSETKNANLKPSVAQ